MIYFNINFLMLSIKMYLKNIGKFTNYFLDKTHAKSLLAYAIFWREEIAIIPIIDSSFLGKHLHKSAQGNLAEIHYDLPVSQCYYCSWRLNSAGNTHLCSGSNFLLTPMVVLSLKLLKTISRNHNSGALFYAKFLPRNWKRNYWHQMKRRNTI